MDIYEFQGILHKKRGGFVKMLNAWQARYFFVSHEGMLVYFDVPENVTSNFDFTKQNPRGRLDLRAVHYELQSRDGHDGSPNPYCFSISPPNDERWYLCAANSSDRDRWMSILERYCHNKSLHSSPKAVSYTSDDESTQRVKASKRQSTDSMIPSNNLSISFPPPPVLRHPEQDTKKDDNTPAPADFVSPPLILTGHQVTSTSSKGVTKRPGLRTKKEPPRYLPEFMDEWLESITALIIMNMCFSLATSAPPFSAVGYIALANFVIAYTMYLRALRRQRTAKLATAAGVSTAVAASVDGLSPAIASNPSEANLIITTAGEDCDPTQEAGGSLSNKPIAGETFEQVDTLPEASRDHTWCKCSSQMFRVRVGPDYSRYQKKAASADALFEPFAVDVFCTKKRIDHAMERFVVPSEYLNVDTHHKFFPPVFVVQIQMPSEAPPVFATVEDGPGWAILLYFKITQNTLEQLRNPSTMTPAVRLFAEYAEKGPTDSAWRARFKVICSCSNLEELGIHASIASWNAKPVLIRRTGSLLRGPGYLEQDIHVHKFANMAKKPIHYISSRCGAMFMQIGFVVEGRSDEELPETLFGCVAVNKPQEDKAQFLFDDL